MFALLPRAKQLLMALSVTGVLALGLAAPVGAVNEVTQGVTAGGLTATIADLTMNSAGYSHSEQLSTSTLRLNIDDLTGSDAGWNVSVQSGDFVWSGAVPAKDIGAANFEITMANLPVVVLGQAVAAFPIQPATGSTGTLDNAITVVTSSAAFGNGSYYQDLDVTLTIPGDSPLGTYTGTLITTISSGPAL